MINTLSKILSTKTSALALTAFLQGCAMHSDGYREVAHPEQAETSPSFPNATLDELLAGNILEKQQQQAQQEFPQKARELKQKVLEVIQKAYLIPLNTPDPKNRATCVIPEFSQQNADNFCLTQCVGRTDEWNRQGNGFRFFLKGTVTGLEERIEYSSQGNQSSAHFSYTQNSAQIVLRLANADLRNAFQEATSLYNDNIPSLYHSSEALTLTKAGDKFTLELPFEKYLKPGAKEAITAEFADLTKLFKIADLAKRKYGVDAWLQGHQAEIKAKQSNASVEIEEARKHVEEQQRLDEQRRIQVEEVQHKRAQEFQRRQVEEQRQEQLRWKQEQQLSALEQKFERSIQTSSSYASLLNDSDNALLFEVYPHLREHLFDVRKIKTSVMDARSLNNLLGRLKRIVEELPENYKQVASKVGLFLYTDDAQLREMCKSQRSAACYLEGNAVIALKADDGYSLPHELAHAWMDHLPARKRQQLTAKLLPVVRDRTVQEDLILDKDKFGTQWKDGTQEPRYSCIRPYGCSNVNEYVGTYVEDIFQNGGNAVFNLLQGQYQEQVGKTLSALQEAGFFGNAQEAGIILDKIHHGRRE